ncbi:TPA: hypothetical protein JLG65_004956 [Escherichia coli]|nr:hypothetical protein [Escherichia coli]
MLLPLFLLHYHRSCSNKSQHTTKPHKQHEAHCACGVTFSSDCPASLFIHHLHLLNYQKILRIRQDRHQAPTSRLTLTPYSPFFAIPVYRKVFTVFVWIPISLARRQGLDWR